MTAPRDARAFFRPSLARTACTLALLLTLSGCDALDPCSGITRPALRVRVQEAGTLLPIAAGSTIRIEKGGTAETHTFPAEAAFNDAVYESRANTPGVYDVRVTKAGYAEGTSRPTVARAACESPRQRDVTVFLTKAP